jgi:hypothetical protein
MLIRILGSALWLIIHLSCFNSLLANIAGSTCHDCFSHLHYITTISIYLHVVFIQRTPIYEHEGFAAYRLMYLRLPCQLQVKLTGTPRHTTRADLDSALELSRSPRSSCWSTQGPSLLGFCINTFWHAWWNQKTISSWMPRSPEILIRITSSTSPWRILMILKSNCCRESPR